VCSGGEDGLAEAPSHHLSVSRSFRAPVAWHSNHGTVADKVVH
jgi:hypothetical protein